MQNKANNTISPASEYHQTLLSMDRRSFLLLLASAAAAYPLSSLAEKRTQPQLNARALQEPWLTIDAVQQHLFPADIDSPGAHDIRALDYLQNMLQAPDIDQEERDFVSKGVIWLNDFSQKNFQSPFIKLDENQRETILRKIEQSRAGERWLSLLLTYLLEALLTEPVYGGNPNGIGWQWLEHQPGYPTPGPDKMYFKLGKPVFKRTKA